MLGWTRECRCKKEEWGWKGIGRRGRIEGRIGRMGEEREGKVGWRAKGAQCRTVRGWWKK